MPGYPCCCGSRDCFLDEDDFNRSDSDDPGSKWHEISGDYDIASNELVTVTKGILATTTCHPTWATLGSFVAEFDLVNIADGETYHFRCGHPQNSGYEVKYEITEPYAGAFDIACTVTGDGTDSQTHTWRWFPSGGETSVGAKICFMPGIMLSATYDDATSDAGAVEVCIGTSDTGNCHTIGGNSLGNFSLIEGDIDNWDYWISWVDDPACPDCGCMCYLDNGGDVACFPDEMTATFVPKTGVSCPAVDNLSVTVYQRDGTSAADDRPDKRIWWSEKITLAGVEMALKFECTASEDGSFRTLNATMVDWSNGSAVQYPIGFGAHAGGDTVTATASESTCDPLSIVFEDMEASGSSCVYDEGPPEVQGIYFAACGDCYPPGTPYALWDVVLTA